MRSVPVSDWVTAARGALADGPAALVTILATEGSAPRGAGTRMVVSAGAIHGTIGGGALEYRVAEQARALLTYPEGAWRVQDYPLGPLLGQCCGGRVRLLVERLGDVGWMAAVAGGERVVAELGEGRICRDLDVSTFPSSSPRTRSGVHRPANSPAFENVAQWTPEQVRGDGVGLQSPTPSGVEGIPALGPLPIAGARFVEPDDSARTPVMLFGAGHVGRAIVQRIAGLPFDLAWFDSRAETDAIGATVQDEEALVACAGEARGDAAVLILTHDHALDYRLTSAALRSPARFVGLIGSTTKRARFVSRLKADGVDPARLTCPIGIAGIAGKEPAVIAIAALAQLLAL